MPTKYFMLGVTNSNYNQGNNWSTTSSAGPANTTAPTASDDVIFDAGSPDCTVSNNQAALSVNFTGYIATITFNFNLTVSGAITLGVGMSEAGTGQLRAGTTATLTSAGHTWSGNFMFSGTSQTYTLADAWVVGTLFMGGSGTNIVNSQSLSAGGLSVLSGLSGNTPITLTGGTWSGTNSVGSNVTLDGDITLSGTVRYGARTGETCTLSYNSGTITTAGSTLEVAASNGTTTFDCAGMIFNTISLIGTTSPGSISLSSALTAVTMMFAQNAEVVFTGTAGWTVDYLMQAALPTSPKNITLVQGQTYTVTTSMVIQGSSLSNYRAFLSSSGSDRVVLNLQNGAGQDNRYLKATRVDSSGGQTIHSYGIAAADISTSLNWDIVGGGFMWLG